MCCSSWGHKKLDTTERLNWLTVRDQGASQVALSGKEPACQCRRSKRQGFNPWVGKIPWRRKWQPTPVLLPGESHGQRSLAGYSPQGLKELDTTEVTDLSLHFSQNQVIAYSEQQPVSLFPNLLLILAYFISVVQGEKNASVYLIFKLHIGK